MVGVVDAVPPAASFHGDDEESRERRKNAAAAFRRRLAEGSFPALFDQKLRDVIAEASRERNLSTEIGSLRFVLARLLAEEEDVGKLAASVARVSSVLVQATRVQRTIGGEVADGLTEAMTRILAELDD